MKVVGTSTPRIEGREKLIGTAQYVDDIPLGDFLWGQTVRASIPYGKIKSVSFDPSEDWSDVTIVTAADIPGVNVVGILEKDWPVLAKDRVYHQMEPIVLLAHRSRERLYRLQSKVTIEYERWDPVLTIDESLARKAVLFKEDNIFKQIAIDKGDADAAFAAAAEVVERTYWTGHHEQAYIETNGMVAAYDPAKKYLKVTGSMQCPFYVLKGLAPIVGLPPERVEIEQAVTGGAFGGKEDFPTILAAHASLLSMKSGLPVKMIYDRPEDLMSTTKRHPCRTVVRTAHDGSGKITALEMDITMDGGAYCTLSPVVLSRGTIHAAGPYNWDNVRIRSRAVATNTPSNGAYRGFGAPQTLFAIERHMDILARRAGVRPDAYRQPYLLKPHQTTATGQNVGDDVSIVEVQRLALERAGYEAELKACDEFNRTSRWERRGIGFATFMHGAGFTGSGEDYLDSRLKVKVTQDAMVEVGASNTEMGQGKDTTFAQIAAETLELPVSRIQVVNPNTQVVPDSGPTVASRTAMIVGYLVHEACKKLRASIEAAAGRPYRGEDDFVQLVRESQAANQGFESWARYQAPPGKVWDEKSYKGAAYGAWAWACYVAKVTLRLDTLETRVEAFDAAQEIGKALNPVIVTGQIEGGVVQAIGWALSEEVKMRDGVMANANFTNYIIPTFADVPTIRVHLLERPYKYGPFGAKGIGELPCDGPAPALLNALSHALGGVELNSLPATPEHLLELLGEDVGREGGEVR